MFHFNVLADQILSFKSDIVLLESDELVESEGFAFIVREWN